MATRAFFGALSAFIVASPAELVAGDDGPIAAVPEREIVIAARPDPGPSAAKLRTRFVVGIDRKVEYQVFSLANPNRVVVELPDVRLRLPELASAQPTGVVRSFRGGLAAPGRARIVIDVTEPVVVDSARIENDRDGGYRLALDILPFTAALNPKKPLSSQPSGLGASGLQPPLPKPAEKPSERAARAFKPIIVLDPGHGGDDSGAMKHGIVEKEVVLAFGHTLRKQLEKTGRYRIAMTRDTDKFIPLGERVAIGERHNANLFIAIHADYARSSARGATIFSLRDGVAKSLERSAKGAVARNVLSPEQANLVRDANGDVDTVRGMLADLAQQDVALTHERTGMFARSVIETMGESTAMRSKPDQQAAFRVLKTAQFPSVLIELAYVTNREDAMNLESEEWRAKVAESIVDAIDNYFSNQVAQLPLR